MIDVDYLLSTKAIRDKAQEILDRALNGKSYFKVHLDKVEEVADFVLEITKKKYPDLNIPYHSRWSHFKVGGEDRLAELLLKLEGKDKDEVARCLFDLVITSVLLDAGAGPEWSYRTQVGKVFSRSEGLAVASFDMFMSGAFSDEKSVDSYRADSSQLMMITPAHIEKAFQVTVGNPLLGVKGRADLLFQLGKTVEKNVSGLFPSKRPGSLYDSIISHAKDKNISALVILNHVLRGFGPIWPGRVVMNDINLGDVWRHEGLGLGPEAFVPFHKLSQWLTYSLLEPLEAVGYSVTDLDQLTGLAEYRNGGLILDSGLVELKDSANAKESWHADSQLIIEWRALTIALLDKIGASVQKKLGKTPAEFPLAKVLEGGTWWAGRKLAQEKRGGQPPLNIISDGTVF